MPVRQLAGAADFLDVAGPLLMEDEARHNLIFGICATLVEDAGAYPEFCLWVVEEGGRVVGAAAMTPPFNLVVARPLQPGVMERLAQGLFEDAVQVPGATGAVPEVHAFAAAWQERTGARLRVRMAQHVYRLEAVVPVSGVGGRMRTATQDDRPLVLAWVRAFAEEALDGVGRARAERNADRRLAGGSFVLWEDGGPVSLAGFGGFTPNGVRIGPVYTPPEFRRRGYAGALVAGMSARLLAEGRRFCFLYTDAANPTSNRIYRAVGYERVCDSMDYAFDPPSGEEEPPDEESAFRAARSARG